MKAKFLPVLWLCLSIPLLAQEAKKDVIDAVDVDALRARAGQDVTVEGSVTTIGTTQKKGITFINLGLPRKEGFAAVIFERSYGAFPEGFEGYSDKKLRVTGRLDLYQGERIQIVVTSPEQIEIVKEP
jgi:hypothetical protein